MNGRRASPAPARDINHHPEPAPRARGWNPAAHQSRLTLTLDVSLVFPHQLFKQHPALVPGRPVVLVEEWLYFRQFPFHQQKLVLHRASMRFYASYLRELGYAVEYVEATGPLCDVRRLVAALAGRGYTSLHHADLVDDWLARRLSRAAAQHGLRLSSYRTPYFVNALPELAGYFEGRKRPYFQTDFYVWQRKQHGILLEDGDKPLGGKWSFDADNRGRFPKGETVPAYPFPAENEFTREARAYVGAHFADHLGSAAAPFSGGRGSYPTTFAEAEAWLEDFLRQRLSKFGVYEDALVADEDILYHGVLTPMLNVGLLVPQQVLDATLAYASDNEVPLNSLEGFTRQILGWREFIRVVYEREGRRQRTRNFWGFTRQIPRSFYDGTTGIAPVDMTIKKLLRTGYNHHIERLMVMGNFLLLCEFSPDAVHQWFMEMYVDSYDWVMVPNTYGMTQFADGGLMTTKPYISGSNYLMKMGDFPKGPWQAVWDGLFWRFMHVHRDFFLQNPRLGMLVSTFDKMSADKQAAHLGQAEAFLAGLG